jgi:hypothetical protein
MEMWERGWGSRRGWGFRRGGCGSRRGGWGSRRRGWGSRRGGGGLWKRGVEMWKRVMEICQRIEMWERMSMWEREVGMRKMGIAMWEWMEMILPPHPASLPACSLPSHSTSESPTPASPVMHYLSSRQRLLMSKLGVDQFVGLRILHSQGIGEDVLEAIMAHWTAFHHRQ